MNDYVAIRLHRNRGWPWHEDSYGLTPMYGEDGWCHACGVPNRAQIGALVLQRKGLKVGGGWVPYWRYDVYCLEESIAKIARERFGLVTRPVASVKPPMIAASQVVIETSAGPWFDPVVLEGIIAPIHGHASETCEVCGVIRWNPVGMDVLPRPPDSIVEGRPPVVASPEWFGSGKRSFHRIIWRRDVADFLVSCSPKDFWIQELR